MCSPGVLLAGRGACVTWKPAIQNKLRLWRSPAWRGAHPDLDAVIIAAMRSPVSMWERVGSKEAFLAHPTPSTFALVTVGEKQAQDRWGVSIDRMSHF